MKQNKTSKRQQPKTYPDAPCMFQTTKYNQKYSPTCSTPKTSQMMPKKDHTNWVSGIKLTGRFLAIWSLMVATSPSLIYRWKVDPDLLVRDLPYTIPKILPAELPGENLVYLVCRCLRPLCSPHMVMKRSMYSCAHHGFQKTFIQPNETASTVIPPARPMTYTVAVSE